MKDWKGTGNNFLFLVLAPYQTPDPTDLYMDIGSLRV